jgi:hypothetical protein
MGISFTFFDLGYRLSDRLPGFSLYYSVPVGGLLCGLLQFRTLRPITDKFGWWILISVLGWSCVAAIIYLSDNLKNLLPHNVVTSIVGIVLLIFGPGLILGLVTGVGFRLILKYGLRTG